MGMRLRLRRPASADPFAEHEAEERRAGSGQLDMTRYFSRNVFVHTHVAKTGGTSFVWGLRSILGPEHVYDINGGQPRPHKLSPKQLREIWVLSGHFWFDTQDRPIARRKRYFVNLRDPVDRFISCYNYVAKSKGHPGYEKWGVLDIEGAYRYLREKHPNAIFDRTCAMFGARRPSRRPRLPGRPVRSARPVTFEEALARMDGHYALVIPMHRIDDAVRRIGAVFGVELPEVAHHNVAAKKITALSDEIRWELRERNAEDYKLMAHFEALFDQHLQDLPTRLTS
jgi:hypothetical protein